MSNFKESNKKQLNFYAYAQKYKEFIRNRHIFQKR